MSDDLSIGDILEAAADYLQTYGKLKGDYGQWGRPRCAIGALRSASGRSPIKPDLSLYVSDWLEVHGGHWHTPTWSDTHKTDEVIDTLRLMAADWRLNHDHS